MGENDPITKTQYRPRIDYKDDLRQAFIVAKYEVMKFLSGKKILIFGLLEVITLALMSAVIFIFGDSGMKAEDGLMTFMSVTTLIALIAATLFSSVTLVSEFDERTSLLLFTKPIRKISIFAGKFMAAFGLNIGSMLVFYIVSAIVVAIKTGGFTSNLFTSFGYCLLYLFALTGIAMLFSSLMKKSSSASIMTFVFVLLVPSIVGSIIVITNDGDTSKAWFILDFAASSITYSVNSVIPEGPRDALVMLL